MVSRQLTRIPLCGSCEDGWITDDDGALIERCPCRYATPTGAERRDKAVSRSEKAHPAERDAARKVVADAAETFETFTANEIRHLMRYAGITHTALIGGAFTWAKNQGLIEDTGGLRESTDEGTHEKRIAVWRSLSPKFNPDSAAAGLVTGSKAAS